MSGLLRGRRVGAERRKEIDKFRTVAEYGRIQNISEFNGWPQPKSLTELPFPAEIKIKQVHGGPVAHVPRQVAAPGTDRLQHEL